MHPVWRLIYGTCDVTYAVSAQCLHWKYFTFTTDSWAETRAELKSICFLVKLIMQKVSYIPLENILADDPLPRMSRKGWIFDHRGGCQFRVFDKFILASNAHERTTLVTIVSYKHNVAAKQGSPKPLATNELWLLELQIKSTRILTSILYYGICANRLLIILP